MAKKMSLEQVTDRALNRMSSAKTVENYNELCRAASLEAFKHLLESARDGNTKSIIELFKTYQVQPKIENYEDLANVDNIQTDDMNARMKQLEMKLRNNMNFEKLTVTIVNEAWMSDRITKTECDLMIDMIRRQTYATRERELQNDIVINLSNEVEDVLQDEF